MICDVRNNWTFTFVKKEGAYLQVSSLLILANYMYMPNLGFPITEEQLKDVAETSGVLKVSQDFISPEFRAQCLSIIPYPDQVEPNECYDAFIYLKTAFLQMHNSAEI